MFSVKECIEWYWEFPFSPMRILVTIFVLLFCGVYKLVNLVGGEK